MSFWKKLSTGLKIALGIAIKADEVGLIRVKELPKIKQVADEAERQIKARTPIR